MINNRFEYCKYQPYLFKALPYTENKALSIILSDLCTGKNLYKPTAEIYSNEIVMTAFPLRE